MVVKVEIIRLHLKNFRNYKNEEVSFLNGINLLFGENAQGKTNIIEALYLFTTGKSHRTSNMNELIMYGESFFDILLEFEDNNYKQKIEIKYIKGKRKELYINDIKKEKISDMLGIVPSVLFAPESLLSVKGAPGERRKVIDIVLCLVNKRYLMNLQRYNRIIKNKNVLLKQIQVKREMYDQLKIWNESQAKTGAEIIEERKKLIRSIEKRMNRILLEISDGKESIKIKYKTVSDNENTHEYESLLEILEMNIDREIEQGSCLYGPHRDDIEINVNDKNSRIYCSQGQQRSVALSMNIGISEELEDKTGKKPLLLLDDVMSELDEKRQGYLLNLIKDNQTILTATEKIKFIEKETGVNYLNVKNGRVYSEDRLLTQN